MKAAGEKKKQAQQKAAQEKEEMKAKIAANNTKNAEQGGHGTNAIAHKKGALNADDAVNKAKAAAKQQSAAPKTETNKPKEVKKGAANAEEAVKKAKEAAAVKK